MKPLTLEQLKLIMPRCDAALFIAPLNAAIVEFQIDNPLRAAAFLATLAAESGQLCVLSENLNYRADSLFKSFPKYFPSISLAVPFANQPVKIANLVYANRMGNGDEASGDGWRYRGAGGSQLTGHNNHLACATHFGKNLSEMGDWLRSPEGAVRSAGWHWHESGVNKWADAGDFDGVCDVVNRGRKTLAMGDSIGWKDRLTFYSLAKGVLS